MKSNYISVILILFGVTLLSSCSVITGIFKAGMWTAVILIAIVVGIIFFVIKKISKK